MTLREFKKRLLDAGISLDYDQLYKLERYTLLLQEWNEKFNLTSITEKDEIYEKHYLDCLLAIPDKLSGKVCDVGTGAGFPGIVWKIYKPDIELTLVEPTGKRCTFLAEVVKKLHLENVTIENVRAEDYVKEKREYFNFVTARAVANLPVLLELCLPLVKVGGEFIAMKGSNAEEELAISGNAISLLGGKVNSLGVTELKEGTIRYNISIKKDKETPIKYPRAYGQIKKKPL